jgi:hypothetical protein
MEYLLLLGDEVPFNWVTLYDNYKNHCIDFCYQWIHFVSFIHICFHVLKYNGWIQIWGWSDL